MTESPEPRCLCIVSGDPVGFGLVESLARPGGNITGISLMAAELHGKCVELFRDSPDNVKYAEEHADIIRRFGRFPHRNRLLGRATTEAEQAFLDGGGFSG